MACSPDWKTFLRLRFVPFPWFCSGSSGRRNTRGGRNRGCEIGVVKSGFGRRSVLRLRFVPFPGFCFGSSGRRNTRGVRNRGCEIGLRQAERPSPPVCSVSVVLFRLFMSAEHSGRRNTRGGRNRAAKSSCEIEASKSGFGWTDFLTPPICSVFVVLFRLFGSAEHSGRRNTRGGRNRAAKSSCEIEGAKSGFGRQSVLRLRFVPFPWFCSGSSGRRNTRGGRNRAAKSSCEIELRNQASVGQIFSRLRLVPFP